MERDDYRGPFDPDLKLEEFSREALLRIAKEYARAYLILQGSWHSTLRARYGDRATIESDSSQWMTSGPAVSHWLSRALKIEVGNVESYFKALQMDPGFPLQLFDVEWELLNPNHGFFTCKKCTALDAFEAEGKGYEVIMCHEEEPPTFLKTALYHHPDMVVRPVKLPPRKSKDEIACKWECRIDPAVAARDAASVAAAGKKILQKTRSSGASHWAGRRDEGAAGWSDERILELWGRLPETTREVLRFLARHPESCAKDKLIEGMGIATEELSHRLGYVYLAMHDSDLPPMAPAVRLLTSPWRYEMDGAFSRAIRERSL